MLILISQSPTGWIQMGNNYVLFRVLLSSPGCTIFYFRTCVQRNKRCTMNEWMNEKGRTGTSLRDQLNQPPVTGRTLRLKVWPWVPGRRRRKMQVSGFAGTVPPSAHHLLIQIRVKMSRTSRVRAEGHPPAGCSASPPSLPTYELGSAQVYHRFYPGCKWFPNRTKQCLQRTSENTVRMNAGSSVLPVSLLPWPRATPCWCFLLPKETEGNLKLLQGVGPQMQEEHFPHWYFKTISQSPNHQPHAITGLKAKNAGLDCVCVCIKTQIIRSEGNSDSQQNSL